MSAATQDLLFKGADWDFALIQRVHDACNLVSADVVAVSAPNPRSAAG